MLIYVLIPAAVFAVVAGLAMLGGGRRGGRRYRPGRPYEFTPVWYLSNPARGAGNGHEGHGRELPTDTRSVAALPAATAVKPRPSTPRGTGGASDHW